MSPSGASRWRRHSGRPGLFEEAATLVAEFAFAIGVKRIEARAVVENSRANRALEKIGAKGEALLRKAFKHNEPQFLWAIVADDWSAPQDPARHTVRSGENSRANRPRNRRAAGRAANRSSIRGRRRRSRSS